MEFIAYLSFLHKAELCGYFGSSNNCANCKQAIHAFPAGSGNSSKIGLGESVEILFVL